MRVSGFTEHEYAATFGPDEVIIDIVYTQQSDAMDDAAIERAKDLKSYCMTVTMWMLGVNGTLILSRFRDSELLSHDLTFSNSYKVKPQRSKRQKQDVRYS